MARIAGVDIPRDKRVEIALTYIYGIGRTTSKQILEATQISPDVRVRDLDENQKLLEIHLIAWLFCDNRGKLPLNDKLESEWLHLIIFETLPKLILHLL